MLFRQPIACTRLPGFEGVGVTLRFGRCARVYGRPGSRPLLELLQQLFRTFGEHSLHSFRANVALTLPKLSLCLVMW